MTLKKGGYDFLINMSSESARNHFNGSWDKVGKRLSDGVRTGVEGLGRGLRKGADLSSDGYMKIREANQTGGSCLVWPVLGTIVAVIAIVLAVEPVVKYSKQHNDDTQKCVSEKKKNWSIALTSVSGVICVLLLFKILRCFIGGSKEENKAPTGHSGNHL